ncbi:uncharacterized protein DUF1080 [Anseongella ginsenosidimutans]|uniref:Uncharacterized protein DUF1080 n=1 Tax=Anseongella ginsenosidimutans TaxID=496056 RepID=A0A4R3KQ71_9SPHI|nr:DUF1080 domain-containing protein [Anseongella ginsenosidimutans]QEC52778.1 DUF1080 domain-containing protein [Anseongella ginsenosidimutans]TCS85538.1 uncharacterized protein DUF1080 [Anseongella ginsenosidimutans]
MKVTRFLLLAVCSLCVAQDRLFAQSTSVSLFDGRTLNGWEVVDPADSKYWKVSDSVITGGDGVTAIPKNTYLRTVKEYEDFEFRCLFRLTGDESTGMINSGIQYRSTDSGTDMIGYQADIGNGYWGDIYDEHRRGKLVGGDLAALRFLLKENGWNSYIVRVKGDLHELYINGIKACEYVEKDPDVPRKGVIAIQLHGGGAAKIELRNPTITEL